MPQKNLFRWLWLEICRRWPKSWVGPQVPPPGWDCQIGVGKLAVAAGGEARWLKTVKASAGDNRPSLQALDRQARRRPPSAVGTRTRPQKNKKRENPGATVVGPRENAAQGKCEPLDSLPPGTPFRGERHCTWIRGKAIRFLLFRLAGQHPSPTRNPWAPFTGRSHCNGPRRRSSRGVRLQEITTRELGDYIKVKWAAIACVLNVMGEEDRLIRCRRGKQKVLLRRATGGREAEVMGPPLNATAASAGAGMIDDFRLWGSRRWRRINAPLTKTWWRT